MVSLTLSDLLLIVLMEQQRKSFFELCWSHLACEWEYSANTFLIIYISKITHHLRLLFKPRGKMWKPEMTEELIHQFKLPLFMKQNSYSSKAWPVWECATLDLIYWIWYSQLRSYIYQSTLVNTWTELVLSWKCAYRRKR